MPPKHKPPLSKELLDSINELTNNPPSDLSDEDASDTSSGTSSENSTDSDILEAEGEPSPLKISNEDEFQSYSPLHLAIIGNDIREIKDALVSEHDINAQTLRGMTPLHLAVSLDNIQITKLLLDQPNIRVDIPNISGNAVLHTAIFGPSKMLDLFLKYKNKGVDFRINDPTISNNPATTGETPLQLAIIENNMEQIQALMRWKDLEVNRDIMLAPRIAPKILLALLSHPDARMDSTDEDKWTPLLYSAQAGHIDSFKTLCQFGANINHKSNDGLTILNLAVRGGNSLMVAHILKLDNYHAYEADNSQNTPLHYAVEKGNLEMVGLLLTQPRINLEAKNNNNQTALEIAAVNNNSDIVNAILGLSNNSATLRDIINNPDIDDIIKCTYRSK